MDLTLPVFLDRNLSERYSTFLKSSLKIIEKNNNIKYYISLNLFNEFHLGDSFKDVIKIVKNLVDSEKAEIILSSSFNIDLYSSIQAFVYDTLYSEYFSGFYLGYPRDFEGDTCIMAKNYHTYFFSKGKISNNLLESMNLLNLERLFVSKNLLEDSSKYRGIKITPIDLDLKDLFSNFITHEVVTDFFQSNNYSTFYLNMFELFTENESNIETNFSNLMYLIDRSKEEWEFIDIDDENMNFHDKLPNLVLSELEGDSTSDSYLEFKEQLIKSFSHKYDQVENLEELRRVKSWGVSGISEVDAQNMFNLSLMSLISREISRKNILLNNHIARHLNDIIDDIQVSKFSNSELNDLISTFKDKINEKPSH